MRRLHFALLVSLGVVAVAVALERRPIGGTPRPTLTDVALPEAALIATVDLTALKRELAGGELVGYFQKWLGGAVASDCAGRALRDAERVTVLVQASEAAPRATSELGVLVEGNFQEKPTLACAERVLVAKKAEPIASRIASFSTLRSRRGGGELAVRAGGPLILGGGGYFRDLIDRSEGTLRPSSGPREALHLSLRGKFGPAPLLVTWVLSPGWLERWLEDRKASASALANVRAVALSAELGKETRLRARILATDAANGRTIAEFLGFLKQEFAPELDAALGSEAAQRVELGQRGDGVDLTIVVKDLPATLRWLEGHTAAAPSLRP